MNTLTISDRVQSHPIMAWAVPRLSLLAVMAVLLVGIFTAATHGLTLAGGVRHAFGISAVTPAKTSEVAPLQRRGGQITKPLSPTLPTTPAATERTTD